ncbi:MAG: DNA cytosine methyltransferase [Oscillospiraceae bacterium]|jgi:DNA (cytosine-5)-methyltransferase 1|nr:DNA cytosine methyltransferase [Oscillospiraceae bacterium]
MRQITLGSLFDGIGAFPFGASLFGIKPLWASEILSEAISVTRRHFSDMLHVGDVTKLSGELLPPVDILTFGSPCTNVSQAGKREGLGGAQSSLFYEAIRIIREMRKATNGKYPRYAIFENVVGLFSSGIPKGSDYRAVLEAFTESEIPMPESGRWADAGMVRGGTANLAWVVYDARNFGLAQRRKRCFALCDFGKGCPEEILLIPKSLCWNPAPSGETGQGITAAAESGVGGSEQRVYGICSAASNSMKSGNPHSGVYEADTSRTLDLNCGNPTCNQGGMAVAAFNGGASPQAGSIAYSEQVSPTLKSASSGLRTPCVCEPIVLNDQGGDSLNVEKDGQSPTLRCNTHGNLPVMCVASTQLDACINYNLYPTITAAAGNSGNNKLYIVHPETAGTLCASGAGLSRPAGMASETDLCVAIDCRNLKEIGEQSGTLQAKNAGGYSLNYQNPIRTGYTVRRLTPTECELLMGFESGYTAYGADRKEISDSKRYSMLGNSIATSCAAYIFQGIVEQYQKEEGTI